MKLSRLERLLLVNQYRILAAVDPDEKDYYERNIDALESGYEIEYGMIAEHVYEKGLTDDECREVLDTLSMFALLEPSYKALADKDGIDEYDVRFHGYDGNNETSFMTYAEYLRDTGRFTNLLTADRDTNSHSQVRGRYQAMVGAFKAIPAERRASLLQRADIQAIAAAQEHVA